MARRAGLAALVAFVACGRIELGSQQREAAGGEAGRGGASSIDTSGPTSVAPRPELAPGHATELPPPSVAPVLEGGGLGGAAASPDDGTANEDAAPIPAGDDPVLPDLPLPDPAVPDPAVPDPALPDAAPPVEPEPPSCRGATEFCGPQSESCCLSPRVEGGPLALPIDAAGTRVHITVSSFWLDKYEVTVGRFRAFLAGYDEWYGSGNPRPGVGAHPHAPESGWAESDRASLPRDAAELERAVRECNTIPLSTLDLPNSSSRIPLNCLTWPEAAAFCAWDDARLPTYAEWHYAAAGGAQDRVYPWGNEPTPSRVYALYGCALGLERPECTAVYVLPAGSHPSGAGLFGQEDLAGSMTEWLLDGSLSAYVDGCVDCVGAPPSVHRFWKSGSWVDQPQLLENGYFAIVEPTLRMPFLGLRCARDGE